MAGLAFISLPPKDPGPQAQGLYLQLKGRFGSGQLFMDVNSVLVGSPWPSGVQEKLQKATVVLAIIGPAWLTVSDQYGRRRLDSPEDWVRLELQTALAQGKDIINVLAGHDIHLPSAHALPGELQELVTFPCMCLRPEVATWTDDMDSIGRRLTAFGLEDKEAGADELPTPSRKKARLPGHSFLGLR